MKEVFQSLDLSQNKIYNLADGVSSGDAINKGQLDAAIASLTALAFVTVGNTSTLSAERALTGTASNISITDNGANSTAVINLIDTAVTPGTYSPLSATVDQKGRITNASTYVVAAYTNLTGTSGSAAAIGAETIVFASSNGVTSVVSNAIGTDTVTISTPQDIQTSAAPTFVSTRLSNFCELGEQGSAPATPSSGYGRIYCKSDNTLHYVDDSGTDHTIQFV